MDKIDLHLQNIYALHASGKIGDAHQLAQELASQLPSDHGAFEILHKIRIELLLSQQSDSMKALSVGIERISHSTSQMLVADLSHSEAFKDPKRLESFGYCCASQNEEDGMLQEVFRRIGITTSTFFEFGVGNGRQNCTLHFLLQGWKGWWIEIFEPKAAFIREYFKSAIEDGSLTFDTTFVSAENIEEICKQLQIPPEIDLLSIDIDGNDYHVFEAMKSVQARVVVLEYNPRFPPPIKMVGAYDPEYVYAEHTYIGASLEALTALAESKGYQLVGCSISGVNAVFVRKDLAAGKFYEPATAASFYHPPRYQLSFSGGFGSGGFANFGPTHQSE